MTRTRLGRIGLALALVAGSGLALTEGAAAADCGKAKERYHVLEYDTYQKYEGKEWVSQPGDREITAKLEESMTYTTSVNGSVGAEAKQAFAAISAQLGKGVMWSRTEGKGFSETRKVNPKKWGHLKFWNEVWKTRWLRYIDWERCPHDYVEEGVAEIVYDRVGFGFWETDNGRGEPPQMDSVHYDGGEPPGDRGGGTPT